MKFNDQAYVWFVGRAGLGILMCVVGQYLACLSNPQRFSLSIADDQTLHAYLMAGLALTVVGVALFLYAVKERTARFSPQLRREVNTGVGMGFALQCAGLLAADQWPESLGLALALVIPGVAAFTWGTMQYAVGKAYARTYGLLGLLGVPGLIVLILLPERTASRTVDSRYYRST